LRETETAAAKLGVELKTFGVRAPDEFDLGLAIPPAVLAIADEVIE